MTRDSGGAAMDGGGSSSPARENPPGGDAADKGKEESPGNTNPGEADSSAIDLETVRDRAS
ncbi:MAG TPA: hypothetical protein VF650_15425 [Allosphingosinicella sp.]|jgi:hypothetical protein